MIAAALEVKVEDYVARHCEPDEHSRCAPGAQGLSRATARHGALGDCDNDGSPTE